MADAGGQEQQLANCCFFAGILHVGPSERGVICRTQSSHRKMSGLWLDSPGSALGTDVWSGVALALSLL